MAVFRQIVPNPNMGVALLGPFPAAEGLGGSPPDSQADTTSTFKGAAGRGLLLEQSRVFCSRRWAAS